MTERRLPVKQLVILSLCRFAEPIALTSVFPYLPEMVEYFGVAENDIARWVFTGIPWGYAADRFGRKSIILLGLCNTMVATLLWGFSTSLPMAITARAMMGAMNGNVGILRTTVAELCPWKELQPRAFSIMPLVYTVGAIIGPTLGGALANPMRVNPREPHGNSFLERYPYCLPNLVAACFFFVGIITGWLFLQETLESKKHDRDYGLIVGNKITSWVRRGFGLFEPLKKHNEHQPLLANHKHVGDEEAATSTPVLTTTPEAAPRLRDVLSRQTSLNMVVYTLLALYTLAYDQLLPVFMHHPVQSLDDPNVSLPLKFAGGFGIGSQRIGAIFTIFSVFSMLLQFLVFPPVARYLGVLRCLRIAFMIFPFVFFFTPFISLLPGQTAKEIAMVIMLMIRGVGGTFAFPTSTIMLTNSASSLKVLGTINGLATSASAVGRASGQAVGGSLFTFGVKHGYVLVPFWTLSIISLLATIPTWWLVEGKGFGDDPDPDEEDVVVISASASSTSSMIQTEEDNNEDLLSESEYGEPANLLTYTSTHSSAALASDDEQDFSAEESRLGHYGRRGTSSSAGHGGSHSHGKRSRTVRRRSSVPIGMGVGFRRLSTNLGSTGVGAGGASWGGAGAI